MPTPATVIVQLERAIVYCRTAETNAACVGCLCYARLPPRRKTRSRQLACGHGALSGQERLADIGLTVLAAVVAAGCGTAAPSASDESAGAGRVEANATDSLTYACIGGIYQDAQVEAFFEPFEADTGIKVHDDPIEYAKVQTMVDAGRVTWTPSVARDSGPSNNATSCYCRSTPPSSTSPTSTRSSSRASAPHHC